MFDIGWPELMVIALITILVMGPREIPRVLRAVQGVIRKIRGFTTEFSNSMDDLVREADLQDIREQAQKLSRMQPDQHLRDAIDPTGDIDGSMSEIRREMEQVDPATPVASTGETTKKTAKNAPAPQPAVDGAAGETAAPAPQDKPEGNRA